MSFSPTSPVTGGAQTGLTSPTYTIALDSNPPDVNIKQYVVTALGGTQTGVTSHSASAPFTVSAVKPKAFRSLGVPNPTTGVIPSIPNNVYRIRTQKGTVPALNQQVRPFTINTEFPVPAGSDANDAANIRAALSLHIGVLTQISASWGDSLVSGIL